MSIHLDVVDHEEIFRGLSSEPILVNYVDISSEEEKERLNNLLYTRYEGDTLDVLPSCDCGELKGEYNVGLRCKNCHTEVMTVTERPLESTLWIAAPEGVHALINPHVWAILSDALTISGFNALRWLCDPTYKYQGQNNPALGKLKRFGFQRGLNHFYENFDTIITELFHHKIVKGRLKDREVLWHFIWQVRDRIFTRYIPVPSRVGFITESTATGLFADTSIADALDAVRTISSIESSLTKPTQAVRESRSIKAVVQMSNYFVNFYKKTLGSKPGWLRRHVYGSRLHFSFRAVISSMSDNHTYDECHLPWSMSVMVFKAHLTSKLLKRGFTPNQINQFLYEHTLKYHSLLDELFQELIAESPYGGIPIILHRNPTLMRGSAQTLRVTKIKPDPAINTISMSVLVLGAPNADFDGDALNGLIILDDEMYQKLRRLEPHTGVLDLEKPRTVSSNLKLPAPVLGTIGNWLHREQ